MKKILPFLLSAALLFSLTACSTSGKPRSDDQSTDNLFSENNSEFENPFADEGVDSFGSLMHGMTHRDSQERPTIEYNGDECIVNYFISASGSGRNFGFLLYVDGIPQPYKLEAHSEYAYLHPISLADDAQDLPFTFIFTPVTGKEGIPSTLTVMSLYNPQFQPNMVETSSYGGYHSELTGEYQINFAVNPPPFIENVVLNKCISNMSRQTAFITKEYLELRDWKLASLDESIFSFISYNGKITYDNLLVSNDTPITIHYELAGTPDLHSQTTFYINHTPIADTSGKQVFENIFVSGETIVYDFEIDPAQLGNFSTFYAVTVPLNASDYPDYFINTIKTSSILFYK